MSSFPEIILASTSMYRKLALESLNIKFKAHNPGVDEALQDDEDIKDYVSRLAYEKAEAVTPHYPNAIIIAADQAGEIVCQGKRILIGKPSNLQEAKQYLQYFSGQEIQFFTAMQVNYANANYQKLHFVIDKVKFRNLNENLINRYLAQEPAFDCAGGIKSESLGKWLIESINNSDPNNLIGLPTFALVSSFNDLGIDFCV